LPDSKVTKITTLHDTPSGDCDLVSFVLANQPFMAISAGPLFTFNPSISFQVKCKAKEEVDALWEKLSSGGNVLMPLAAYPFSERYGWVADRYGLSWQVMYAGNNEMQQKITPVLMFVGDVCGKAEEAITFYTSVFHDAKTFFLARYGNGEEPDKEGTAQYGAFTLEGTEFGAMDSAREHPFAFNEAISFLVPCETQDEIDYYWQKLSADPKAEQCGWLKDQFGLSWQIWPTAIGEMMTNGTREQIDRITQAFLPMKKFDLATLQKAYEGTER
jgi:predicted 3-demethylubiquinone-9 3-methyltransferase (glyoxalase superfamily)